MTPCSARVRLKEILEIWNGSEFPHDRNLAHALAVLLSEQDNHRHMRVIMPCSSMSPAEITEFCLMHGATLNPDLTIQMGVPEMRRLLASAQNAVDGAFHKLMKDKVPRKFQGALMGAFREAMSTRAFP